MKKIAILSVILMAVIVATVCFAGASDKEVISEDISSALSVIAEQNKMAKYGIKGNSILFSADDFEKNLNLSGIVSITVTETPSLSEGTLCLGDTVLTSGQTISRSNLDLLNYRAAGKDISTASFKFKVNGGEYEMTCKLYLLDRENSAPTVTMEDERSLKVSTHTSIMVYGMVGAYDPEGDDMRFEVVSYPKNGVLTLTKG